MMIKQTKLVHDSSGSFTLDKKSGRILSAIVNMSNPALRAEEDVGGIRRIEWRSELYPNPNGLYDSNVGQERFIRPISTYEGERVSDQFCVEVGGHKDQIEAYFNAMTALLSFGKEKFRADAYELTGLMTYLWAEDKYITGEEGDHIGFASAIFYAKNG